MLRKFKKIAKNPVFYLGIIMVKTGTIATQLFSILTNRIKKVVKYFIPSFIVKFLMRLKQNPFYVHLHTHRMYVFKVINRIIVTYISARHLIFPLKMELKSGDLTKGIHFLSKKYPLFKPRSIRFLISLYKYLLKLETTVIIKKTEKKSFIIHFCCWGDAYAQKAREYLLPSLLAEGNLPAISKKYDAVLFIHCDSKTREELDKSQVLNSLQRYATLNIIVLPETLFSLYKSLTNYPELLFYKEVNRCNHGLKYLFLGALQAHALSEGLRLGALVSFLIPDSILSDSFFSHAVSKIKDKKLILTTTFRTSYDGVREHLKAYYQDNNNTVCAITGAQLSKLQIEHLHDTDRRRLISKKTNHFLACARFIFKVNKGFILRALHYHPVLIDCQKLKINLKVDYFPIDDAVLKQILVNDIPYEEQAWLCSDPREMNFMELSGDNPEVNEPPVFTAPSTYDSLINSIYLLLKACPNDLDEKLNRFFIQNKLSFIADNHYHPNGEVIDSNSFISDLYNRIDNEKT